MSIDLDFYARLRKLVDQEIRSKSDAITEGHYSEPDYKREAGYIKGLKDVLEWCDMIASDINKGD